MKKVVYLLAILGLVISSSCQKKKGCTDSAALNHDIDADKDDNSCEYSECIFYQVYDTYIFGSDTLSVTKVEVSVNGEVIGNCSYAFGNSPPNNCMAFGAVMYKCIDGEPFDWNTITYLSDGSFIPWEGIGQANSDKPCIKIPTQQ